MFVVGYSYVPCTAHEKRPRGRRQGRTHPQLFFHRRKVLTHCMRKDFTATTGGSFLRTLDTSRNSALLRLTFGFDQGEDGGLRVAAVTLV